MMASVSGIQSRSRSDRGVWTLLFFQAWLAIVLCIAGVGPADAAGKRGVKPLPSQAVKATKGVRKKTGAGQPVKAPRLAAAPASKRVAVVRRAKAKAVPERLSYGQRAGLHATHDPLELKSSVALVTDQDTGEILFQKNEGVVLPIASLTKLMTAVLVADADLDMNELITITADDIDTEKGTRSRLEVGAQLPRRELMLLALMSSENRAAHALGRTYPGGLSRFVRTMNAKARMLGMADTRYVDPTGLSSRNQSSAMDLHRLTAYASQIESLSALSVAPEHQVQLGEKSLNYVNTNRLVRSPDWQISLQKTGFISEAGHTLVMQTKVAGRRLIMVFLDSAGKLSRLGDAERVRRWVEGVTQPKLGQRIHLPTTAEHG